jgi:hypothetical protein
MIYSLSLHISKLNDLEVIHDVHSQYLIEILPTMILFTKLGE